NSLNKNDKQFWRRALVRSLFAFIEGMNFRLKRGVLVVNERIPLNLTTAELSLLKEEQYIIDKGEPVTRKANIRLVDNLEFSFKMYFERLFDRPYDLKKGTKGWEAFIQSIKIRDRITHPKASIQMSITDDELEIIKQTFDWYRAVSKDVFAISI